MRVPARWIPALVAAILLALPPQARAGEPAVRGQLSSPSGAPIQNFPVIIQGPGGERVATTDEKGEYSVQQLPPGTYRVAPANEPGLAREIEIIETKPPWWEFWNKGRVDAVDVGKMTLQPGKKY